MAIAIGLVGRAGGAAPDRRRGDDRWRDWQCCWPPPGYAVSAITVRVLARTDSTQAITFWLLALMALGAGALAWPHWVPLRAQDAWIIGGIGIAGALGQYTITEAFRLGEASLIAPLEYTALIWGVLLDLTLWGVLPDAVTWLGAAIIIASGLYLIRREKVHAEAEHP